MRKISKGTLSGSEGVIKGQLNAPGGSDVRLTVANEAKASPTLISLFTTCTSRSFPRRIQPRIELLNPRASRTQ